MCIGAIHIHVPCVAMNELHEEEHDLVYLHKIMHGCML